MGTATTETSTVRGSSSLGDGGRCSKEEDEVGMCRPSNVGG